MSHTSDEWDNDALSDSMTKDVVFAQAALKAGQMEHYSEDMQIDTICLFPYCIRRQYLLAEPAVEVPV